MVVALTEVEEMGWEEVCQGRFGCVVFEIFAVYLGGAHIDIQIDKLCAA